MTDDLNDTKPPAPKVSKKAKKRRKWTRRAKTPLEAAAGMHAELVSVKDVTPTDYERLVSEIDDLKAKLADSEAKRSIAANAAIAAAEAQGMLMQSGIEEVPTGEFVEVERLDRYKTVGYENKRPVLEPVFKTVRLPTFAYKIDMPPCGGTDLKINGVEFYHGATYTFDIDTLRTVKDIVYRTWKHDREIHGSDENFYRTPQKPVLRGSARR